MNIKYKNNIRQNNLTVEEVINLLVYNPYKEDFWVMVDKDERIHIKGDTWLVILDHNTGDFSFSGELHKYYEVDVIKSIRDSFGQIYSFFNVMYDSIPTGEWILVPYKNIEDKIAEDAKKETEEERIKYKQKWQLQYYYRKKEELKKKYMDKYSSILEES